MKDLTPFGERLVAAMKKNNITDAELAKRLDVAPPNIYSLKYKTVSPRETTLKRIAKAVRTTPEALVGKWKAQKKDWATKEKPDRKVWLVVKEGKRTTETRIV